MQSKSFSLIGNPLSGKFAKTLALPVCTLAFIVCAPVAQAVACTATGFIRDAIDLTAAMINPSGVVSGDVDATGCNIGIYYSGGHGKVTQANVHGANYFGIVNNGGDVDILNSTVSDIGETPFNGSQHGIGIWYDGGAKGDIRGNFLWAYQKNGIVINHAGTKADVEQNHLIGFGPVDFIAQNGIEIARGATAKVRENFVSGIPIPDPTLLRAVVSSWSAAPASALTVRWSPTSRLSRTRP